MAISFDVASLHDLPPGTHLYFSEEYNRGDYLPSAVSEMTITERMVADYYEANWELGAMHWSGDYDELECAVIWAVTCPAGSLEDAARAWEPAAELACLLFLDDETHRGDAVRDCVAH